MDDGEVVFGDIFKDLIFFGVVGIRNPLRNGAKEAVQAYQKVSVIVRIVTGYNILTAKAIAKECGILSSTATTTTTTSSDIAMEGP
jgi:P-type Ca2+ transporter type 2C